MWIQAGDIQTSLSTRIVGAPEFSPEWKVNQGIQTVDKLSGAAYNALSNPCNGRSSQSI